MKKAVFIDRDGTLIDFKDRIYKIKDVKLIPGAAEAITKLNDKDYKTIIISNQAVVARGMCSLEDVISLNEYLVNLLKDNGATIDGVYFCPHHPTVGKDSEYTRDCDCRKPKIGMLLEASNEHDISINNSYVIGDNTSDIEMGKRAGCKTILVRTGYGGKDGNFDVVSNFTQENIYDGVVNVILNET